MKLHEGYLEPEIAELHVKKSRAAYVWRNKPSTTVSSTFEKQFQIQSRTEGDLRVSL